MERWLLLQDYPGYSISDLGRIRNDKRDSILAIHTNQYNLQYVSLMQNGIQAKRSLARMVCEAFVPVPTHRVLFDTPIHLNGDPLNCEARNLTWRPRWFAIKHSRQFKQDLTHHLPVRNRRTRRVYAKVWDLVIQEGLLFNDVIISISYDKMVFPTTDRFEWAI